MLKIKHGDCLTVMAELKHKFHLVLADPPYDCDIIGKNWDQKELERRLNLAKLKKYGVHHIPYGNAKRGGSRNRQWFKTRYQQTLDYTEWTYQWARLAYRVLYSGGYIAVFINSVSAAHVQVALERAGFYTKELIILVKPANVRKGMTLHQAKMRRGLPTAIGDKQISTVTNNLTEIVVLAHKPFITGITTYLDNYQYNGLGFIDCNDLPCNVVQAKKEKIDAKFAHINRKPLHVVKSLIAAVSQPGHKVLDPFCGSGTTGVACQQLNRHFLGIEKELATVKQARLRLKNGADTG